MDYMTQMENKHMDRIEEREKLLKQAEESLRTEFMAAFYSGDTSEILRTPGFSEKRQSMTLLDYASYDMKDQRLMIMLKIVADAAKAGSTDAQWLIEEWADDYAKFHAEDAAGV